VYEGRGHSKCVEKKSSILNKFTKAVELDKRRSPEKKTSTSVKNTQLGKKKGKGKKKGRKRKSYIAGCPSNKDGKCPARWKGKKGGKSSKGADQNAQATAKVLSGRGEE